MDEAGTWVIETKELFFGVVLARCTVCWSGILECVVELVMVVVPHPTSAKTQTIFCLKKGKSLHRILFLSYGEDGGRVYKSLILAPLHLLSITAESNL